MTIKYKKKHGDADGNNSTIVWCGEVNVYNTTDDMIKQKYICFEFQIGHKFCSFSSA